LPCSQGCSYGGANGGLFHDLLPDMLAEFNASNPRRCKFSQLPYCACANRPVLAHTFPPPPPITYTEDYHTYAAYKDGEHVVGGGGEGVFDVEQGQVSALVKRVTNVHTIDLALRSSHRMLSCPGENDGEQACARNCAAEHLSMLRAFTVTGMVESPSVPPSAPSPTPSPAPPLPPHAPFSECQNTCQGLAAGDTKCRDGGKGSWLPTVCPYATQCAQCGFREHTRTIVSDDSCATASNGVCEDGGFGSETFADDPLYTSVGQTTNCGLGTDATDCQVHLFPRTAQEITSEAFQGVTNETSPAPPPPMPQSPPPPPPPPGSFNGYMNNCTAYLYPDPNSAGLWLLDCSGSQAQITEKRTNGLCAATPPSGSVIKCSDGGHGSASVRFSSIERATSVGDDSAFGCNYGTSTSSCNPRTLDATTDTQCSRVGDNFDGGCRDSCWVDTQDPPTAHHTDERYDLSIKTNAGSTGNLVVDTRCHDGGPGAVSNMCGYGTQVRLHN
jgi:hypothetical protein